MSAINESRDLKPGDVFTIETRSIQNLPTKFTAEAVEQTNRGITITLQPIELKLEPAKMPPPFTPGTITVTNNSVPIGYRGKPLDITKHENGTIAVKLAPKRKPTLIEMANAALRKFERFE